MSSIDAHKRHGEEPEATIPPGVEGQSDRDMNRRTLRELQAYLDRALSKYYLGEYGWIDDDILHRVVRQLEEMRARTSSTRDGEESRLALLYAMALTLQGQIYDRRGDHRASEAFTSAVAVFDEIISKEADLPIQYYAEYGIALHMITGRQQDARSYLEEAIYFGFSTPETHRHLGLILRDRADNYRVKSQFRKAARNYDKAVDEFEKALKLAPDDPLTYRALGETLEARGQPDEASAAYQDAALAIESADSHKQENLEQSLVMLQRALSLTPNDAAALTRKESLLRKLGRHEEAQQVLNQTPVAEPTKYVQALAVKGEMLQVQGNYEEALRVLEDALALEPDNAQTLVAKGKTLRKLGRYEEALRVLNEALRQNPDYARALAARGETLRDLGRYEEALQAVDRALALEPKYTRALAARGETLRLMGRYEEALRALNRALVVDQNYTWALGSKGETLRLMGRYEEALRALNDALKIDPDYAFGLGTKGAVLYALKSYEDALRMLNRALVLDQNYTFALVIKAQILCDAAYYRLALEVLERAEQLNSSNIYILVLKGWALENLGENHAETLQACEDALKMDPENPYMRKAYANVLYLLDDEAAEIEYSLAIEQASELAEDSDVGIKMLMGWCYFRLREYDKAVKLYEETLEVLDGDLTLDPAHDRVSNMVSTQFDLALALMCDEQHKNALDEYTLALRSAQRIHDLRRRGLLHVARQDLKVAVEKRQLEQVGEVETAQSLLKAAFDKVEKSTPDSNELQAMTKAES